MQGQPISFDDAKARTDAVAWAVDVTGRMYDALDETLRARAQVLRSNAVADDEERRAVEIADS